MVTLRLYKGHSPRLSSGRKDGSASIDSINQDIQLIGKIDCPQKVVISDYDRISGRDSP
jgi:hypothetical protein